MSQLSKDELFYIKQKYFSFIGGLINKLTNDFVFNLPIDKTEWPEMKKNLEEIRELIAKMPGLTFTDKAVVEKYLVDKPKPKRKKATDDKPKRGRPTGSKNTPRNGTKKKTNTTNKPKKSLLECALNKQGLSLKDIDENFNPSAKKSKSQEVSEGNVQP